MLATKPTMVTNRMETVMEEEDGMIEMEMLMDRELVVAEENMW
jgi:hypothetical protein